MLEHLERDIDKEVAKLKHYMEPADKLIENNDYLEMKIAVKLGTQIISKITDLISQLEGLKLDFGASGRDIRQWKKDKKKEFSPFVQDHHGSSMEAWTTQTTSVCTSKRRATTRSFTAYDQQGKEFQETIQA